MTRIWCFAFLAVSAAASGLVSATHPAHHVTTSLEEFLKGEFEGVSVTSDGRLILAPAFEEVLDTSEAYIHSAALGSGGTLYVGTGSNGRIFRLPADGRGGEWAKLDEPAVFALAVDSQNRVYAGTSPDGKVYRLSSDGAPEVFFEPGDKFIWDIIVDDADNVYVATGPRGVIYRVAPNGQGRPFFDSEETHIVKLAWDLNKNLLAGSAPGALLFRISPAGDPFVLLDSSLEEMKCIAVDRYGNIFAAALSGGGTAQAQGTEARRSEAEEAAVESTVEVPGGAKGGKLEVYRIDRGNMVETLYSSDDELAFDLVVRADGSIVLATGNRGRVISLSPRGFSTLLVDSREEQVTRLVERGGSLLATTSNLGKVYRLSGETSTAGTYESDVIDAGMVARWGSIGWTTRDLDSPGAIRVYTRSGNTQKADRTWTNWSGPYDRPGGSAIQSEPARFLQWKAEFAPEARSGALLSQRGALDQVRVSYMQYNMPPKLQSLTVLAPGVAFLRPPTNPAGGVTPGGPDGAHARSLPKAIRDLELPRVTPPSRRVYIPGARSFNWKASDPNGDSLVFSLYYLREGETDWVLIADDLTDEEYTLDGISLPDGIYTVKVVASDHPSNPPDQALRDELVSKPFVIANSVPWVEWQPVEVAGNRATLQFVARSRVSPLYQVEYSVDGGNWTVVFPEDGITDSTEENYRVVIENLAAGRRSVTVRAVDNVGNLGTAVQSFQIQ
jgi:hypothetical protein